LKKFDGERKQPPRSKRRQKKPCET